MTTHVLKTPPWFTASMVMFQDGTTAAVVNGLVSVPEQWISAKISEGFTPYFLPPELYAEQTGAAGVTLASEKVAGAISVILRRSGVTGAASDQLPAAAEIVAAAPGWQPGQNFQLRVINNNTGILTLTTNTGLTLTGTMTLDPGTFRDFTVSYTVTVAGALAVTFQSIGTGTDS
jgi:hypothetical protein